jgi:hypothetical protein
VLVVPAVRLIGAVAAASLVLSACGDSHGVDRAAYAHQVCTSIAAFEKTLTAQSQTLSTAASNAGDEPATIKKAVAVLLDAEKTASARLTQQLASAGYPKGSGGKALANALTDAARAAQQVFGAQPAALAKSPTTDSDAFTADLDAIGTATEQGGNKLEDGLNEVGDLGDLKTNQAFAADPTCSGL